MSTLVWSEALSLSMPVMDATHQEFVDLLALVEASEDAVLLSNWKELVAHTEAHFAREDQWMQATGFAAGNCHSTQHAVVLDVLHEGSRQGAAGHLAPIRQIAHELAMWFPHHAQNMDFGLALHLKSMGYDTETGLVGEPDKLPDQAITGCGGACGSTSQPPASPVAAEATAHP